MSDAAVTIVVAGVAQVAVALVAFLTLWVKIRYGIVKTEEAAESQAKTAGVVEQIHTATNSDREKMERRLAALETTNAALLARIDGLHSDALSREQELLVQGRQTPAKPPESLVPDPRHPGGPGTPPPPPPPVPRRETP